MHRRMNMRDAFPRSADEHAQQVLRLLQHRRADMDATWEELEEGWKSINERMVECGLNSRTSGEGAVKLNVGGSNVTVCWHILAETEGFEDSILGALLEGSWGNGRIPVDADGRIVLDESPTCITHIIHAMLRSRSIAVGLAENAARSAVAIDEAPCLIYTAHVMGLPGSVPAHSKYVKLNGGSTILEPFEIAPLGAQIREWVGSSTEQMTLIYCATRDGFETSSFKPRCNKDSPHTVSLFRVKSGQGNDDDSVVGAYSVLPWGGGTKHRISKETFLFVLKDGSATRKNPSKPIKWSPYPNKVGQTFTLDENCLGAFLGGNDLFTWLSDTTGRWHVATGRDTFDVEKDSPFLALNDAEIVDIEVYRYSTSAPPSTTAPSTTKQGGGALTDAEAHDIGSFGRSIASSLMEERVVLDRAVKEMEEAGARVCAAVGALKTVYGPSVAAGEQDTVVELSVRGTRMTTLRSTLQACPHSALATMFDEDRWSATDKDKDEHGGRLIDCDPICFSKILDVLRMRKRASWNRGVEGGKQKKEEHEEEEGGGEKEKEGGGKTVGGEGKGKEDEGGGEKDKDKGGKEEEEGSNGGSGAVLIKQADTEAFGEAVNMYFPGCESFIVDLVQSV